MKKPKPFVVKDLQFFESTHRYFYKGKQLIGPTEVFELTGLSDFSKVKWEILEEAKLLGDYVHELARLFALKKLNRESVDDRLQGYLKAIERFFRQFVKKVIAVETPVCDSYNGYGGIPDLVFVGDKGRIVLPDYKTSSVPYPTWPLQTAAYKNAWNKCFPSYKVQDRMEVILRDDGTISVVYHKGSQDFDKFLAVLKVAQFKLEHKITT